MRYLDIDDWNRKEHYEHFKKFFDPYFGVVVDVEVTETYRYSREHKVSFFALYLHACLKAINSIDNLKYRIVNDQVVIYDVIHASATILRDDATFGFSFVHFAEKFDDFNKNLAREKDRILGSTDLYPPVNTNNCIYCSALPWTHFSGHKEPISGREESIPKLAFGKFKKKEGKLMMPVSISVNHALVDGYHVGVFFENFQKELNKIG